MKDYFGYQGKVCVVTGASSGMGRAAAEMLVDLGAEVYALDMNPCKVEGIAAFIEVNLSEKASIDEAFEKIPGKFDKFFGIAGLSGLKTDYTTTFNVNYTANMYITETYVKDRITDGGAIVYVSSAAGIAWRDYLDECKLILGLDWDEVQAKLGELISPMMPGVMAYMFSKRLVCAYTCQKAIEYAPKHVTVNVVLPGSTDTGMKDEFAAMAGGIDNMVKAAGLAGRLATSEEMGEPIVFLGSDMASFISGEEMIVDCCDNGMKKLGLKPEQCVGQCIIDAETFQKMYEAQAGKH